MERCVRCWGRHHFSVSLAVTAWRPKQPGCRAGAASRCPTASDRVGFPSPELTRGEPRASPSNSPLPQQGETRFSAPEPRQGRGCRGRRPTPRLRQPSPGCPGSVSAGTARRAAGAEAPLPAAVPPRGGGSGRLRPHLWRGGGGGSGRRSAQTGRRSAAP